MMMMMWMRKNGNEDDDKNDDDYEDDYDDQLLLVVRCMSLIVIIKFIKNTLYMIDSRFHLINSLYIVTTYHNRLLEDQLRILEYY